jgi:putative Mg2+ transporter-C (MgtC) family protein
MISLFDITLRLLAAMLIGCAIGFYCEMCRKPTGIRTLGLVGLASALAVLAVAKTPDADASRVIQGVMTGVGFLGAGVILHGRTGTQVLGLTTAATIWITACLGVLCGLASWQILSIGFALTCLLLILGGVCCACARPCSLHEAKRLGRRPPRPSHHRTLPSPLIPEATALLRHVG